MELMSQHRDCIFSRKFFTIEKQKCDVISVAGDYAKVFLKFFIHIREYWPLVLRRNKFSKICPNFD